MGKELLTTPNLKSRGWTDALIRKFLAVPDECRPNPKYPNAASPMKLYRHDRVVQAENSNEFRDAKEKADKRKVAAKKAVETKLRTLQEYLGNLDFKVTVMDQETLIEAARRNFYSLDLSGDVTLSNERMCVNYLRHCATKYETELATITGKAGAVDAYYEIKEKVLNEIAITYDWLAEECDRQLIKMNEERRQRF